MSTLAKRGGALTGPATGPQTTAAYEHMVTLGSALTTAAVLVVRAWLIEHNQPLIGVDIARAVVAPATAVGNEALDLAARCLPPGVYSSGLDIRGHFTVRLSALNEHLGRAHDDREPITPPAAGEPRIEALIDRDPDGGTEVQLFIDGTRVSFDEYGIDPGWGYEWDDWVVSRAADIAAASSAVAAVLWEYVLAASESQYIENAPDNPDQRARELAEEVERHQRENNR